MKIGNPSGPAPAAAPAAEQTPATAGVARPAGEQRAAAAAATTAPGDAGAKVELSSTATTMLAGSSAASADFDAEKVARISQSIADGSFKIDAGAIADKLITNALEVLRNGTGSDG